MSCDLRNGKLCFHFTTNPLLIFMQITRGHTGAGVRTYYSGDQQE